MQSRDGSSNVDVHWDEHPKTLEEIQAILQKTKEATLKREKALAHAFSHQVDVSISDLSLHDCSVLSLNFLNN